MKFKFLAPILLVLIIIIGFIFKDQALATTHNLTYYSSCSNPKGYKIGNIDERFGIGREELLDDLNEATGIWSKLYGKSLFVYDPNSNLTVNLTYDRRQELNSQINNLDSQLKEQQSDLFPKMEQYKKKGEAFNIRLENFNDEVKKWNSQGGAPPEEYDRLIKEQEALKQEAAELNQMASELGQSTDKYNEAVSRLNQTVNIYGEAIQGRPEEGLYEKDGKSETITIYLHNSKDEFIHTLTHEFGHALGLNHVNNPQAIMHAKTNEIIDPSNDDIEMLQEACQERFVGRIIADHYKKVFQYLYSKYLTN